MKLKIASSILTRNRKYQLHEDRPYDIVKEYRRTFRSLFLPVHRQFAAVSGKATKENREQESDAF